MKKLRIFLGLFLVGFIGVLWHVTHPFLDAYMGAHTRIKRISYVFGDRDGLTASQRKRRLRSWYQKIQQKSLWNVNKKDMESLKECDGFIKHVWMRKHYPNELIVGWTYYHPIALMTPFSDAKFWTFINEDGTFLHVAPHHTVPGIPLVSGPLEERTASSFARLYHSFQGKPYTIAYAQYLLTKRWNIQLSHQSFYMKLPYGQEDDACSYLEKRWTKIPPSLRSKLVYADMRYKNSILVKTLSGHSDD